LRPEFENLKKGETPKITKGLVRKVRQAMHGNLDFCAVQFHDLEPRIASRGGWKRFVVEGLEIVGPGKHTWQEAFDGFCNRVHQIYVLRV